MSTALIIEDGTNVANANSFATLTQIRDYNSARGVKVSADDDEAVALALQAMDYLATYEERFAGQRTFGIMQALCFPRSGMRVMGKPIFSDYVPSAIIAAQSYIAGVATDVDLYGVQEGRAVTDEKIGPLETAYAPNNGAVLAPLLPYATTLLKPFFRPGAGMLTSRRV